MSSKYSNKIDLILSPQNFTSGWVNMGPSIYMDGYHRIILYPEIDINDTLNARIRVLEQHTPSGNGFYEVIENVTTSVIKLRPAYSEIDSDADQRLRIEFEAHPISYVQVQISAGTVGENPGNIASCKYCLRKFNDD